MRPERWQQVKAIFNSAIQRLPEDRNTFLLRACSGDDSLRNEVESLIASHEKSGAFIDNPAYERAAWLVDEKTDLLPGQNIGTYQIVSLISRGGMGEVYLAQDQRLNRKVALKLLPASSTKDVDRLSRFEQEARAASALNHPNIITIYEIQKLASTHLIATEFVEGETLRQRLSRLALTLPEVLNIAIQVADAISAAHKVGIIHRDIKPENIMIRPDGYVKVLDFGLAKLIEPTTSIKSAEEPTRRMETGSGVIIGTIGYMSPEQARGKTIDARSDIFNLGAVIYEMVAGHRPFDGDTPSDVLAAILKSDPLPLSHYFPEVPAELVRIVNKALRKDPEERYQVTRDLLLDLKSLKEDIDFQVKLDRSVVPSPSGEAVEEGIQLTTAQPYSETSEIRTAISTITNSLSVEIKRHKTSAILLLVLLGFVAVVGGRTFYKFLNRDRSKTGEKPEVFKTTQITFSPGFDGFPSLSPDGKSVLYSSDQNGSSDLYIKQLTAGGGELRLTSDGQENSHPAWSPDGQRIAYYSKKRGGIWLVSALGGNPKQLTEFGARPAWSPDGSMIAFQSGLPGESFVTRTLAPSSIWIVPSAGGEPKQVTKLGDPLGGHSAPTWSPDGKRIAFEASDYIFTAIWSAAIDGSDLKKIIDGSNPVYAREGHYLYFTDIGLSRFEVSPSGEPIGEPALVEVSSPGTFLASPAISADGKTIVYSAIRILSNLWTVPLSSSSSDATGPAVVFSPDTSQRNNLARFSPDGHKLALNRWRPGSSADIWVADADGKNLVQLTSNPAADSQASWFPEGDRIAFLSRRSTNYMTLWTISLTTGKEEQVLDLGEGIQFAQLSPDAKQLAFNFTQKNGSMNVWVASLKDGQRRQLTFDSQLMGFPCWSPDGQYIAYEWQRGEDAYLMVVPSSGGQPIQLTFDRGKSWPHSWSADGDKIAFAGQHDGVWNIYWISRSTKVQKQLTHYSKQNAFVRYPAWSPLGNQIVYEYAEITGNILMMELK